jgi:hypothetical protein
MFLNKHPMDAFPSGNPKTILYLFFFVFVLATGVGVPSPNMVKKFLFSTSSRLALESIQWVPEALSPEVKRPGREADHSPPTSAKVKKMWIYTSSPPEAFMA